MRNRRRGRDRSVSGCPNCGYPDTFDGEHYKGLYVKGQKCDHCGFQDPSVMLFDTFLTAKLQDPKNLPALLGYAVEYLKRMSKKTSDYPLRGCVKILEAAQKELRS